MAAALTGWRRVTQTTVGKKDGGVAGMNRQKLAVLLGLGAVVLGCLVIFRII